MTPSRPAGAIPRSGSSSCRPPASTGSRPVTDEVIVVPLSGGGHSRGDDDASSSPAGSGSSPARPTSRTSGGQSRSRLSSAEGGRFALCGARTEAALPPRRLAAAEVPSRAARGRSVQPAGPQLRHPGRAATAGAIIACEVITPGGNWSSYPAHKHDEAGAARVGSWRRSTTSRSRRTERRAWARPLPHLVLAGSRDRPAARRCSDRDIVLVPYGWHGPAAAAPGHDMYYLNVMAGPGPERAWKITDHPGPGLGPSTWSEQAWTPT